MRIRMLEERTGPRYDGQSWPPYGGEIDVPGDEGAALCARGSAVPVPVTGVTQIPEAPLDVATETRAAQAAPVPVPAAVPAPVPEPAAEPPSPVTEASPPDPAPKPIVNAPKSAWVDHAVERGFDRAVAESMTKADLVARFGRDADAPQA